MRAPSSVPPPPVPDHQSAADADHHATSMVAPHACRGRGGPAAPARAFPRFPCSRKSSARCCWRPGKRLRPALALHVAQIVGGRPEAVAKLAAATEVLHSATLVHDDIVDSSPERRGQPAVHVTWSQKIAVLAGDYLFATAADLVAQLDRPVIVRLFAATIHDMSTSEFVAPSYDDDGELPREQYLRKDRAQDGFAVRAGVRGRRRAWRRPGG